MKYYLLIFVFLGGLLTVTPSCRGSKNASERRGLMMPKKNEVSRNKHFKDNSSRTVKKIHR